MTTEELAAAHRHMLEAKDHKDAGHYADAERCYRQALEIRERLLGLEHSDTAQSAHDMG